MNERFLYRGKRLDNKEWVYGWLFQNKFSTNKIFIKYFPYNDDEMVDCVVDSNTVGQCIGLKDDNKKLIYEHDIVRYKYRGETDWKIAKVEWQDWASYPAFDLTHTDFDDNFGCNAFSHIFESGNYDIEVIGNMIDSPDLYK